MNTPKQPEEQPDKRKAPAFQFYVDDFLAGTLELSQADVGAYIRLLCFQWNRGSIPVETEKQQRLAGGSVSVDVLAKFRLQPDGRLVNERMERERQKQIAYREMQAKKGIASGKARRKEPETNSGSTTVEPTHEPNIQPEGNSPSPSPVIPPIAPQGGQKTPPEPPAPKRRKPRANLPLIPAPGFDLFWAAYPAKLAKTAAIKAWNRLTPDDATTSRIVADVQARRNSHDWTKDMGQFIPHPSTYLNQRRWEDMREALAPVAAPGAAKPVSQMSERELLEWATR